MLKKVAALAALEMFLKYIKKDWKRHPFFEANIIDKNGDMLISKKDMSKEQLNVYTHLNVFIYKIKRIIQKNIFLKWSIISAITSSIFLKESESEYVIGEYENDYVVIHKDSFHSNNGVTEIISETGPLIVDSKLVNEINLVEEVTSNTTGVAGHSKPLASKNAINTLKRRKKKCKKKKMDQEV